MAISAAAALHRFGLGARPGDLARIGDDARGALKAEIETADVALLVRSDLPDTVTAFTEILKRSRQRRELIKAGGAGTAAEVAEREDAAMAGSKPAMADAPTSVSPAPDPEGAPERSGLPPAVQLKIYHDEVAARSQRVLSADIGFAERLVAFWTNHFSVEAGRGGILFGLVGAFEREAIRPHILGRFEDMLFAATKHPAMLLYLNNAESMGPDSPGGRRLGRGLNENHARELLELHTVGVDGGYTQTDVTSLARVLTGWTVGKNERRQKELGDFVYRKAFHEPAAQVVMEKRYEDSGMKQGEAVLSDLARHPATAKHLATKCARHFVADAPPATLVDRLTKAFSESEGDLRTFSFALVDAEESWGEPTKLKSPQEFLWSSARALNVALPPRAAMQAVRSLGQPFWNPPSPRGFPDDSSTWLAPDAIADRLDFAQRWSQNANSVEAPVAIADQVIGPTASKETRDTIIAAESPTQGLALMLMSPEFQRR